MDQWEAAPPSHDGMPRWARVLIGLLVVMVLCVAYLWFFGFQTGFALGARYFAGKRPVVSMAPVPLPDASASLSAGKQLSYFGYEFVVPWNDVDDTKTKMLGDNKALIVFRSGNTLSVWHGSPRAFVNSVLSNDKIDPTSLRRLFGDEALSSDFALYRTMLETTPGNMTPFMPRQDAVSRAILLIVKGTILPRGTASGVFTVKAGEFSGFQFGRPQNQFGEVSVRLFSNDSSFNFIFNQNPGSPTVISQPDINRVVLTLHKATASSAAASKPSK